jgi:thiamine-phosphate pyrophosphorylase
VNDFGLYVVMTDPVVGYARCAEAAVRSGVEMVQLRMKNASRAEVLRVAREVRSVTKGTGTNFIVNDDPQIAAEEEADGVHVGQGDMTPGEIRRRFPGLRIIGLSTHNPGQTEASASEPIDYIGVGPVYATPTKEIPDPVLGLDGMRKMLGLAAHPAVAIGGIDESRIKEVVAAGARNFAVVRAVCKTCSPYREMMRLKELAAGE